MAVDMAVMTRAHLLDVQQGKVAKWLLSRKRSFRELEKSDVASCNSQQSQQTFLDGDSPCSANPFSGVLATGNGRGRGPSSVEYEGMAPPSHLSPPSKRHRSAASASALEANQQRRQQFSAPQLADPEVHIHSYYRAAGAAGTSPAHLHNMRCLHDLARQTSWPYTFSPLGVRTTQQGALSSMPSVSSVHTVQGVRQGTYFTPANHNCIPPAHPLAPEIKPEASQAAGAPFNAVGCNPILQQLLLSAILQAAPAEAPCKVSMSLPATSSEQPLAAAQQLLQLQGMPSASAPQVHRLAHTQLAPTQPAFRAAPLSQATAHPAAASHMAPLPSRRPQHPRRMHPEQQAQLHALCDQLLSKTLAAAPSAHSSPAHGTSWGARATKIPALHGPVTQSACTPAQAGQAHASPQAFPAAVGPSGLLTNWAIALALQHPDSVFLSLHLWNRARDKVGMHTAGQRKGVLAACLWVATKHEECRRGIPPASRLAMVVGIPPPALNSLELTLLGALGWNPLAGWDDGTHSKGQLVSPKDPAWNDGEHWVC